jgi:ubiquinone/menaquinone biosynthesis C-methylase UbiE
MSILPKLPRAFKSGLGYTYEEGGEAVAGMTERMLGPWNRSALITEALPKLDGIVAKLQAGARVADVGCGSAVATTAMAKAFPKSEFHGYDNSKTALAHAEANKEKLGVRNVHFHNPDNGDGLPAAPTYDLMTFLDVLHDMARPDLVLEAARKAIKADGQAFIVDVKSSESYEENLAHPLAAMMYSISIMLCMSSSSSTPDGLKLGTVGLPEPKMRELVKAAGFSTLKPVEGLDHPFNAYYTALP